MNAISQLQMLDSSVIKGACQSGVYLRHTGKSAVNENTSPEVVLERLKDDLLTTLDRLYPAQTIPDLIDASTNAERFLLEYVRDALVETCYFLVPGAESDPHTSEIQVGGRSFEPRIVEDVHDHTILNVAFVQRQPPIKTRKGDHRTIPLQGYGRYSKVHVWPPYDVGFNRDWLAALTQTAFGTAYSWLTERVREAVSGPNTAFASELYGYLVSIMAREDLVENIWFLSSVNGRGVFLLQPRTTFAALETLSGKARDIGESALRLVCEFLGTDIPEDQLFSTIAVRENQHKIFDLAEAKFKHELPLLVRAEAVIFGAESISILPIYRGDCDYLVAVMPTRQAADIAPILNAHREEIATRYVASRRGFARLHRLIRERRLPIDAGVVGDFTGAAVISAIKRLVP